MFCPECQAEYRQGFTVCADCDVPLVPKVAEPPASSRANESSQDENQNFGADEDDPFCMFWEGEDSRICADLCSVLEEADIPYRVLRREARLFRISAAGQIKLGVPFSLYQKAEIAVVEAFGGHAVANRLLRPGDENRAQLEEVARQSFKNNWEEKKAKSALSIWFPNQEEEPQSETLEDSEVSAARNHDRHGNLDDEELSREVWSGTSAETSAFLTSCLQENNISCDLVTEKSSLRIFTTASDEPRAREIVREVTEASPPLD